MYKNLHFFLALGLAIGIHTFVAISPCEAVDSSQVKALFADPPREYSSGPLWVWNDMLTDEQIISTLNDLAGQNVKQVWVHPRPTYRRKT